MKTAEMENIVIVLVLTKNSEKGRLCLPLRNLPLMVHIVVAEDHFGRFNLLSTDCCGENRPLFVRLDERGPIFRDQDPSYTFS